MRREVVIHVVHRCADTPREESATNQKASGRNHIFVEINKHGMINHARVRHARSPQIERGKRTEAITGIVVHQTEEGVRCALQHIRRVSRKSYFSEYTERTGCSGGALVAFKNGKIIVIGVEPPGRINIFEADAKLEPTKAPESFYDCAPCKDRKMKLLTDALDRADERRLRKAEAEGKITSR
jgi:hypothetical protein